MGTTCSIDAFDDNFSEPAGGASSSTRASPVRSMLHPAGPPSSSSYHQQYHQQFLKAEGSDYISSCTPSSFPSSSRTNGISTSAAAFVVPEVVLVLEALTSVAPRSSEGVIDVASPPHVPTEDHEEEDHNAQHKDADDDNYNDGDDATDDDDEDDTPSSFYLRQNSKCVHFFFLKAEGSDYISSCTPSSFPSSSRSGGISTSTAAFVAPEVVLVLEALTSVAPRNSEVNDVASPPHVPTEDHEDEEEDHNAHHHQDADDENYDGDDATDDDDEDDNMPSSWYSRQNSKYAHHTVTATDFFSKSNSRSTSLRGYPSSSSPLASRVVDNNNMSADGRSAGRGGGGGEQGVSRASLLLFPPTSSFGLEDSAGTTSPYRSILSCPTTPRTDSISASQQHQNMRVSFFSHAVVLGSDGALDNNGDDGEGLAQQPSLEGFCDGVHVPAAAAPPALAAFTSPPASTIPFQSPHGVVPQHAASSFAPQISITSLAGVTLRRSYSSEHQLDGLCDEFGVASGTSATLVPLLCPTTPQRRQLARRGSTRSSSSSQQKRRSFQ
ncbi:Hypothetical protein, putative [Bodo saltans]|uniref:Uncharacterized protein n=1 Tax=Bodo saltans TaxID=75058 RepID=A0A0S4IML2_BODSA|nr:Hypothetical protein, putative [Bodo saltans]|eukprot:CUF48085.1 Hypothetical protein, putative [Bodo saltans]